MFNLYLSVSYCETSAVPQKKSIDIKCFEAKLCVTNRLAKPNFIYNELHFILLWFYAFPSVILLYPSMQDMQITVQNHIKSLSDIGIN